MSYTEEANKRGCYCNVWDKNPGAFEKLGYPRGFCGFCEECGEPGHSRHYPGPVPYTGCWCDKHFAEVVAESERQFGGNGGEA